MLRRFEKLVSALVVVLLCAVPLTTFAGGGGGVGGGKKPPNQQPHKIPKSVPKSSSTISAPTQVVRESGADGAKVRVATAKATRERAQINVKAIDVEIDTLGAELRSDPSNNANQQKQVRIRVLMGQRRGQTELLEQAKATEAQALSDLIAFASSRVPDQPLAATPRGVAAQTQFSSDATASTSSNAPPPIAVRRVAAVAQTTARPTPSNNPGNGGALANPAGQPAAAARVLRSAPAPLGEPRPDVARLAAQGAQVASSAAGRPQTSSGFTGVKQVVVDPVQPPAVNAPLQSAIRRVGASNVVPIPRLTPAEQLQTNRERASGRRAAAGTRWGGAPGSVALDEQYDYEFLSPNHLYGRNVAEFQNVWKAAGSPGADFEDWVGQAGRGGSVQGKAEFDALVKKHGAYPSPVTYLSPVQSAQHQLRVNNGEIGIVSNQPLQREGRPVVFVVHPDGNVLLGNYERGKFHHSSLRNGGNVLGAGELYLNSDGTLRAISDKSGHYLPDGLRMLQALAALKRAGVVLTRVPLSIGTEDVGTAEAFLNKEGWRLSAGNLRKEVNRERAEALLRQQPEGTWLIREGGTTPARDQGVISRVKDGKVEHLIFDQVLVQMSQGPRPYNPDTDGPQLEFVQRALGLQTSRLQMAVPSLQAANAVSTAQ